MADDQDDTQQPDSEGMKALRQAADEGKAAKREAAAAQRELALVKAGIDTDTPLGKMFSTAYDGDLTSDAIKAAAAEVGLVKAPEAPVPPPTPTPAGVASVDDAQQGSERRNLGAGSEPPAGAVDEDPRTAGLKDFDQAMQDGKRREDASIGWFGRVVSAGASGDERVIVRD